MTADRFGNRIDPSVGYARGALIRSSADEVRRLRHGQSLAGARVMDQGADSIGIFTGNSRAFPLVGDDVSVLCEEWIGPGLFKDRLRDVAVAHLGGGGDDDAAVFNRTSAGLVASVLALSDKRPVVSVVPDGDRSHASVMRGCRLAGVPLVEVEGSSDCADAIDKHRPGLVVVTTVTSALNRLDDARSESAVAAANEGGAVTLLDEAYGARLRPVLHDGAPGLSLGADLSITNADKAGLAGPRAGVMAGSTDALIPVVAQAAELGMEARAPVAAGAMRSLESFDPTMLLDEARDGRAIADVLAGMFGEDVVQRSDLGPMIDEEDVHAIVMARADIERTAIVPAEMTAALGMLLLRDHGVLTTNSHGQPGGRVSLRLKPTPGAVARVGGAAVLGDAVSSAIDVVAEKIGDPGWFARLMFGDDA
ncbi:MAG: selenocysteine synthase [Pseudomonadota bacterium]